MTKKYDILLDFEQVLNPMFREVGLIREIPLSDPEENQIQDALRELLCSSGPGEVTQFLRNKAPCTLAYFLVWKGIRGYQEGDYWAAVCDAVSLSRANWPQRWGEIFEDVLERFRLPKFPDSGGHRFVTPILIHGGIPDYCLDDFFDRLVWPAVTGRLDYNGNIEDLFDQWQDSPLPLSTDKPVRRFLAHRGKIAADFLQRCVDMALQAYDTGDVSNARTLELPEYVIERFEAWLKKTPPETLSPMQRYLVRYCAPEAFLNAAAGCLLLAFPSQRLSRNIPDRAGLRVAFRRDGALLSTTPVRGVIKGESIETEPFDLDLGGPGERYEVTLVSGEQRLR